LPFLLLALIVSPLKCRLFSNSLNEWKQSSSVNSPSHYDRNNGTNQPMSFSWGVSHKLFFPKGVDSKKSACECFYCFGLLLFPEFLERPTFYVLSASHESLIAGWINYLSFAGFVAGVCRFHFTTNYAEKLHAFWNS